MTRALFAAAVLVPGVGCLHFQPVGPLASALGDRPAAGAKVADGPDAPAPEVRPAQPPAPPALLVSPGEITEANWQDAVRRVEKELEADRKALEAMPQPAEVSVIKK